MPSLSVPMDIYESPQEIVILIPLGWVQKKSVELYFDDFKLQIKWVRVKPKLKADFIVQQEECYRGEFMQEVQLPPYVYFDRIHSAVSVDNILTITIPKSLHPGKMKLDVKI
jgi:HSP20 family molecular chaperone IbpA